MVRSDMSKSWEEAVEAALVPPPEMFKNDKEFCEAFARVQREKYEWIRKTAEGFNR